MFVRCPNQLTWPYVGLPTRTIGDPADTAPRRGGREQTVRVCHLRREGERHCLPGEAGGLGSGGQSSGC